MDRASRDHTPGADHSDDLNGHAIKGSGSQSGTYYAVEARLSYNIDAATTIAGQLIGPRWQQIRFVQSPIGVPVRSWEGEAAKHGLYGLAAAQALRAWFIAAAAAEMHDTCLETRLVSVRWTQSYDFEEEGVLDVRSCHQDGRELANVPRLPRIPTPNPKASHDQ